MGVPVCEIYKASNSIYGDAQTQGATVAFNIRSADGLFKSNFEVGRTLRSNNIHIRTGSLCNPGGMAIALDLSTADIKNAFDAGFRCNQTNDIRAGKAFGMARVTLGAMSTLRDVRTLLKAIEKDFVERDIASSPRVDVAWTNEKHPK